MEGLGVQCRDGDTADSTPSPMLIGVSERLNFQAPLRKRKLPLKSHALSVFGPPLIPADQADQIQPARVQMSGLPGNWGSGPRHSRAWDGRKRKGQPHREDSAATTQRNPTRSTR